MAIEAVIFDYGKVLSNSEDPDAQRRLIALTGLERPDFDHHYWRHRHDYDQGRLNGRTYWEKIAGDAGLSFTPGQIDELIETDVLMWTSLNEEMLCWVIALQEANIKTAILSNMGEDCLAYMRQEFGWLAHFQHHTWSCELGICKPDPAIYIHTCEKLKVPPPQTLFLDDKPENIATASQVGLNAIQFENIEQLRRDLEARGLQAGLPVPGTVPECEPEHLEKLTFDA
ncbi:MAG TPA: HAD family phosphatase [Silvibacterium sp.]|nr:HAD family phosphatase [Silvibacterium sp.]